MKIDFIHSISLDEEDVSCFVDNKFIFNTYELRKYPCDATLDDGLSFVFSIPDLIRRAYDAGKNGEVLELNVLLQTLDEPNTQDGV